MLPEDLDYQLAVNAYGFYCIPDEFRHREVCKTLLGGKINEPRTLSLVQRFAGAGDVVSGGAFIGDFLPALARALDPKAKLHSFEPNPAAYTAASTTVAINRLNNVTLHPVAVGAEDASLPLQIKGKAGDTMGGLSSIVGEHIDGQTIEVPVKTIDEFVGKGRTVSVIQLDIEGFEWPALQGAQKIIKKDAPVIIVETLKTSDVRVSEEILAETFPDAGYKQAGVMERNTFYVPTKG